MTGDKWQVTGDFFFAKKKWILSGIGATNRTRHEIQCLDFFWTASYNMFINSLICILDAALEPCLWIMPKNNSLLHYGYSVR